MKWCNDLLFDGMQYCHDQPNNTLFTWETYASNANQSSKTQQGPNHNVQYIDKIPRDTFATIAITMGDRMVAITNLAIIARNETGVRIVVGDGLERYKSTS